MEAWQPLAASTVLLGLVALRLAWRPFWRRQGMLRRFKRAAAGEREAEAILARAGYRVAARQVSASLSYRLDGAPVTVEVRADLLVERGGRRYVAEVKTGAVATELTARATRRQLLEYAHAFDVQEVLLVDADRGRVRRVGVPRAGRGGGSAMLVVGIALGAALATLIMLARGM